MIERCVQCGLRACAYVEDEVGQSFYFCDRHHQLWENGRRKRVARDTAWLLARQDHLLFQRWRVRTGRLSEFPRWEKTRW